jgi:hypothetical protein
MKNRKTILGIVSACLLSLFFACVPPGAGENTASMTCPAMNGNGAGTGTRTAPII